MRVFALALVLLVATSVVVSARLPPNLLQLRSAHRAGGRQGGLAPLGTAGVDPNKLSVKPKPLIQANYVSNICDVKRGDKCNQEETESSFVALDAGMAVGTASNGAGANAAAQLNIANLKVVPKPLIQPVYGNADSSKDDADDNDDADDDSEESYIQIGTAAAAPRMITPAYLNSPTTVDDICSKKKGANSRCNKKASESDDDDDDAFIVISATGTASQFAHGTGTARPAPIRSTLSAIHGVEEESFLVLGAATGTATGVISGSATTVGTGTAGGLSRPSAGARSLRSAVQGIANVDDYALLQVGTASAGLDQSKLKVTPKYLITANHVDNICDVKKGAHSRCNKKASESDDDDSDDADVLLAVAPSATGPSMSHGTGTAPAASPTTLRSSLQTARQILAEADDDDDDSFLVLGQAPQPTANAATNQAAPWGTGGRDGGPLGRGGKPVVHAPELKIQPVYVCNGIKRKTRCADASSGALEPVVAHNKPREF
jgi:hypothetical protein